MMKKICLFKEDDIQKQIEVATKTNDTILKVRTDNQIRLNNKTKYRKGCDLATLNYIVDELKEFNKDRRSYGINTGIEIAIDIIEDIRYKENKNERN